MLRLHFTDVDNNWTTTEFNNTLEDNAALDAHWGELKKPTVIGSLLMEEIAMIMLALP